MTKNVTANAAATATANPLPAMRAGFTGEQKALIKQQVARGCTDTELALFLHVCESRGLDPLTKQIYAIKRGGQMTIQVGIDGARSIAARTGRFMPGREPSFAVEGKTLVSATVYAKVMAPDGSWHEISDSAYFDEYKGSTPLWTKMPKVMLSKCAEMRLLRRAFPDSFGGIYEPSEISEMDQAGATSPGLSGNHADTEVASSSAPQPARSLPKSVAANFPELAPKPQPTQVSESASPSIEAELVEEPADDPVPVVEYDPDTDNSLDKIMDETPSLAKLAAKATISDAQRKAIFAAMREAGLKYEDLKPKINKAYSIKSMKELPADRYEEMLGRIKATARQKRGGGMSDTIECLWCEAIVLREDAHPLDAEGENHQCESCNDDAHERRTAAVVLGMKDLYRDNFESDRGPLMAAVVWTCGLLYNVAFYFVVITVLEWIF